VGALDGEGLRLPFVVVEDVPVDDGVAGRLLLEVFLVFFVIGELGPALRARVVRAVVAVELGGGHVVDVAHEVGEMSECRCEEMCALRIELEKSEWVVKKKVKFHLNDRGR